MEKDTQAESDSVDLVLVDDHAIWRGGVRALLAGTEFRVVGEASSGSDALAIVREKQPRLVLLDIRMAGGDGLDALHALKKEHPLLSVVMLTTYDNPTYMARAVAGGASGYLLKGVGRDEMLSALRAVSGGESLLQPEELVQSLRSVSVEPTPDRDWVEPLTEREEEVLRLLSTGINNRDLAAVLFIAESTAKTHVERIIRKLGVSDRVQAAVWAARQGYAIQ